FDARVPQRKVRRLTAVLLPIPVPVPLPVPHPVLVPVPHPVLVPVPHPVLVPVPHPVLVHILNPNHNRILNLFPLIPLQPKRTCQRHDRTRYAVSDRHVRDRGRAGLDDDDRLVWRVASAPARSSLPQGPLLRGPRCGRGSPGSQEWYSDRGGDCG